MALPNGDLKLSEIAAEFGGSKPHKLSEYYGKSGVPSSGTLKMSQFRGKAVVHVRMKVGFNRHYVTAKYGSGWHSGWGYDSISGGHHYGVIEDFIKPIPEAINLQVFEFSLGERFNSTGMYIRILTDPLPKNRQPKGVVITDETGATMTASTTTSAPFIRFAWTDDILGYGEAITISKAVNSQDPFKLKNNQGKVKSFVFEFTY